MLTNACLALECAIIRTVSCNGRVRITIDEGRFHIIIELKALLEVSVVIFKPCIEHFFDLCLILGFSDNEFICKHFVVDPAYAVLIRDSTVIAHTRNLHAGSREQIIQRRIQSSPVVCLLARTLESILALTERIYKIVERLIVVIRNSITYSLRIKMRLEFICAFRLSLRGRCRSSLACCRCIGCHRTCGLICRINCLLLSVASRQHKGENQ